MLKKSLPPVFFEILRSFTTLARTLNLTHTVSLLGVTRQTVRRHINELEKTKGGQLFILEDRQYKLTPFGNECLANAEHILLEAEQWVSGQHSIKNGLIHVRDKNADGNHFHAQQYPVIDIWENAPPLIQRSLESWTSAQAHIEDPEMESIRPYMVVFRKKNDDWVFSYVGEKSSYATWLGWEWAKSAVGNSFSDNPTQSRPGTFLLNAYNRVSNTGGIWYDHVSANFRHKIGGDLFPANYQRIVFATKFPDGSKSIASIIARTNNVRIAGHSLDESTLMPDSQSMEFEV